MITIRDTIACLERHSLLKERMLSGVSLDTVLSDITFDNRTAGKGSLFVCKGAAFKKEYLLSAFDKGASVYLSENVIENDLPHLLVSDIRLAMSKLAAFFFAEKTASVKTVGITGTKGKTTVSCMLKSIFDSYLVKQRNKKAALISSLYIFDGGKKIPSKLTTPEAIELWRHLAKAGENGLPLAVLEVSSQALKYHRVSDVPLDTALFLNLGNDHISPIEHPDLDDYFASKLRIFHKARRAVIGSNFDRSDQTVKAAKEAGCEVYTFGHLLSDTLTLYDYHSEEDRDVFTVSYCGGIPESYAMHFRGRHNVENAMAAILTAKLYGIAEDAIAEGLLAAEAEGRGEEYRSYDNTLRVIVDYAHNGMSLDALYRYVEEAYPDYRVITLFGCPGGKAENRRRDMALSAGGHSDLVILTEDDPDCEDAEEICLEIAGYLDDAPYLILPDRASAIAAAFACRFDKTVILLCGKGAERTQRKNRSAVFYEGDAFYAKKNLAEYEALLPLS